MSDDLAQGILCLSFMAPAGAILLFAIVRKNIGGTDIDNSAPILEDDESVHDTGRRSKLARRVSTVSIALCLALVAGLTIVTVLIAGNGTAAASGKCPLGF
jgi:hypothetical protein